MFYNQFERLCRENGTSPTEFTKDVLKLSTSKVTAWKNGSIPKQEILFSITEYFRVSVGYLFDGKAISENELSPNEKSIVELFKELSPTQQGELIGRAKVMVEQNEALYKQEGAG